MYMGNLQRRTVVRPLQVIWRYIMALITKKIKGTEDVLPRQSYRWQFIEGVMREEAKAYGFKEIRTPVFEHTELFARGVGQTTDVVQKEMYTFDTKGGESGA